MLSRSVSRHVATVARTLSAQGVTPSATNVAPFVTRFLHAQQLRLASASLERCARPFSTSRCLAAPKKSTTSRGGRPKGSKTSTTAKAKPKKKTTTTTTKKKTTSTAKRKPTAKTTAKTTAKPRTKKAPSEHKTMYIRARELKPIALLDTPRRLPGSSYTLFASRNSTRGTQVPVQQKEIATKYRQLSTGDRQHLVDESAENRVKNERALHAWIVSHSPEQIRLANEARRKMNSLRKASKATSTQGVCQAVKLLKDDRKPRRPLTPYFQYMQERKASGDFQGVKITEMTKALGKEWQAMGAQEKERRLQEYGPIYEAYEKERKSLYPNVKSKSKYARSV
ncbi:MAG: hypothetical protein M1828_002782 [Chrysothrix sp. TS-e1954]|nr:MAG: hypothetical protein M1828_002782 [Chrysothrix sp. TS-e1954]